MGHLIVKHRGSYGGVEGCHVSSSRALIVLHLRGWTACWRGWGGTRQILKEVGRQWQGWEWDAQLLPHPSCGDGQGWGLPQCSIPCSSLIYTYEEKDKILWNRRRERKRERRNKVKEKAWRKNNEPNTHLESQSGNAELACSWYSSTVELCVTDSLVWRSCQRTWTWLAVPDCTTAGVAEEPTSALTAVFTVRVVLAVLIQYLHNLYLHVLQLKTSTSLTLILVREPSTPVSQAIKMLVLQFFLNSHNKLSLFSTCCRAWHGTGWQTKIEHLSTGLLETY